MIEDAKKPNKKDLRWLERWERENPDVVWRDFLRIHKIEVPKSEKDYPFEREKRVEMEIKKQTIEKWRNFLNVEKVGEAEIKDRFNKLLDGDEKLGGVFDVISRKMKKVEYTEQGRAKKGFGYEFFSLYFNDETKFEQRLRDNKTKYEELASFVIDDNFVDLSRVEGFGFLMNRLDRRVITTTDGKNILAPDIDIAYWHGSDTENNIARLFRIGSEKDLERFGVKIVGGEK